MTEPAETRLYVCFEPDQTVCAERLDAWPRTNEELAQYNERIKIAVTSPQAEATKARLCRQIAAADVLVCLITQDTFLSEWVDWEIGEFVSRPGRHGMVGILLHEFDAPPMRMVNAGSIFVPFRRDAVEQGIAWAASVTEPNEDFLIEKD